MLSNLKTEGNLLRILTILLIAAVGIYLFGIFWRIIGNFSEVIIILISAWLLSFIIAPTVEKITNITNLPRVFSALLVYMFLLLVFAAALFMFLPTVISQIQTLIITIPPYLKTAPPFIAKWTESFVFSVSNSITLVPSVAQFFLDIFIISIISFYFVVDKERISQEMVDLTPQKWRKNLKFAQEVINNIFASFLRVQLFFGVFSGIVTWVVLRIFGIDFAASIALIAGILAVIPVFGPILSIIPPTVVSVVMDPAKGLIVFLILLAIQQVIFNVIGPRLLGKAFKLHPVIILISFLVGAKIAGGIGAIFAIPVLGIIAVIIRNLSRQFLKTEQAE